MTIYTIGHSTRAATDFQALLAREGIHRLVDIRMYPGSRRHPQFNQDTLARALADHHIEYQHLPALGGRRRLRADIPSNAWRSEGFRAYAQYMTTDAFRAALTELIRIGAQSPTTIMCSEAVPWRCHRLLVSDALVARGETVCHIVDDKLVPHVLTAFAVVHNGDVTYPAPSDSANEAQPSLSLELG